LAAGALVEYGLAKIMSNVIARPLTAGGLESGQRRKG